MMRKITATAMLVAMTLLALAGGTPVEAGGGCHSDTLTDARGVAVVLEERCFQPMVVRVDAGQQVTFTNNDPDAHTVTGVANSWGDYEEMGRGDAATYQFDKSGVFPYFCLLHPSMVGAVVVGDGSAATTGAAGDDGVKVVSARVAGGQGDEPQADAITDTDDRDNTVPIAIGVGVLAALAGFAGAFALRRKSAER